ncbi:hypothetical protein GCM10023107_75020 [Actinoplanes octamycinicus]|nr:hypothetical protein Aoc01nite_53290 [Actinoplanes octamycinicus]
MTVPGYISSPAPKTTMSRGKKAGLIGAGILTGLVAIGVAAGGGGETPAAAPVAAATTRTVSTKPAATEAVAEPVAEPTTEPAATEAVAEPTKELTVAQQNAVEKAADYLSYSSFSRSGLIKQLKFEGFSTKDATFGVDAQKADWNEQAAKKAAEYLDFSSFSRSGLIKQLKFEGFTTKQANYGVKKVGL